MPNEPIDFSVVLTMRSDLHLRIVEVQHKILEETVMLVEQNGLLQMKMRFLKQVVRLLEKNMPKTSESFDETFIYEQSRRESGNNTEPKQLEWNASPNCDVYDAQADDLKGVGKRVVQVIHTVNEHSLLLRCADSEQKYSIGSKDTACLLDVIDRCTCYVTVNNTADVFVIKFNRVQDAEHFLADANSRS